MVIFVVILYPLRPSVMSLLLKDAGTLVGNGPSVSVGATVHVDELVPVLVTVPVPDGSSTTVEVLFLQPSKTAGPATTPMSRLLKNLFLSMIDVSCPKDLMKYRFKETCIDQPPYCIDE
jgi:hypothetical protein